MYILLVKNYHYYRKYDLFCNIGINTYYIILISRCDKNEQKKYQISYKNFLR